MIKIYTDGACSGNPGRGGWAAIIIDGEKYTKDGIEKWILKWKKNGWKTASKQDVKNIDLWKKLDELNQQKNVQWSWVKAHADNEYNNMADELARSKI